MFNYDSFSLLYLSSLSPAHIYIFQQGQTHPLTAASLQFPIPGMTNPTLPGWRNGFLTMQLDFV